MHPTPSLPTKSFFWRPVAPDELAHFAKRLELDSAGTQLGDQIVDLAHAWPPSMSATMASISVRNSNWRATISAILALRVFDVDGFAGVLGLNVRS